MRKFTIVLHIYSLIGSDVGGTQYATSMFARWLAKKGHRVYIVTQREQGLHEKETINGYKILRVPRIGIPFFGTMVYFMKVAQMVQVLKADIFQEQGICGLSLFVKWLSSARCVVYGRGGDVFGSRLRTAIPMLLSLTFADRVIALTNYMKESLQREKRKEVLVIPNANFNTIKKPRSYPKRWNFVSIGRLHQEKGNWAVVSAVALLRKKGWDVRYVCIGDGKELSKLKKLAQELGIQDYVTFKGHVPHEKIASILSKCDLFVFPTNYPEGFPNVFLDAFAAGLPVITSTVSGNSEIIRDGILGFCVSPNDPKAVAEACERIMKDKKLYERMSRACIAELKKYEPDKVYSAILKAYDSLL